jgi:hypothetical protein
MWHVAEGVRSVILCLAQRQVDWELHHLDSTIIGAHQHAAGARTRGNPDTPTQEGLGRSRGGFSTKVHLHSNG